MLHTRRAMCAFYQTEKWHFEYNIYVCVLLHKAIPVDCFEAVANDTSERQQHASKQLSRLIRRYGCLIFFRLTDILAVDTTYGAAIG